jgi:hypothetical protein
MNEHRPMVVWVRPAASPRRTAQVLRWLRWLLPAALLVVTPSPGPPSGEERDAIVLDAEDACSGPLSTADALARGQRR